MTKKTPENKILAKLKLDMYYVNTNPYIKFQVNMSKDNKKKSGKVFLTKGDNLCKSKSNATKVKLDLYYVKTNSYMKFQRNTSKDNKEKSGKRNFSKGQ